MYRYILKLELSLTVQHLLLVGGFGESPYLQSRLRKEFSGRGTEVVTVENSSYALDIPDNLA